MMARLFWLCVSAIVYTYAGYPLLLALLARRHPRPVPNSGHTPPVTVLIAAYNEEEVLANKLENTLALDYPPDRLQVLVAADGSQDRTAAIAGEFAARGVELSYRPQREGKMAAINRAMDCVRGEVVVFSDANNLYAPETLQALVTPFSDPQVGAVSGAKSILAGDGVLGESEGLYWKYESFIKKQETRLGSCTGVAGEILAVRKDLFQPASQAVINDDFYLAMQVIRQGYRVVYTDRARTYERVSLSAEDEIARRTRINAGRYQAMLLAPHILPLRQPLVVWQVVSHKFLRPLVPLAMIGAWLANLAAVLRRPRRSSRPASLLRLDAPWNYVFLGLQGVFYGLACLGRRRPSAARPGRLEKILYLPAFLFDSNLAALAGLYRYLTGRQTVLWQRVRRRANQ
ncbi:MAG: glycosyltransferase family 2 protein [Chloroflexi bacterium]|nr:glycosyltransferase family 2 protein [Chloroflexota bacterium]